MPVRPLFARGGRCGFSAGQDGATAYQKIHHFIALPVSLHPSSPPDSTVSSAALFIFYSHILARKLMHMRLVRASRRGFFGQRVHVGAIGRTYLSLYFQICLISYQDHRELVSVFYPKDLSLEFVDFFEAVEEDTHAWC